MQSFIQSNRILLPVFFMLLICCGMPRPVAAQIRSMETPEYNYTHFRPEGKAMTDAEVVHQNEGYETHPELGRLFAGAPCNDCYEILPKRTENTKTFTQKGTNGSHVWVQSSIAPMHYKDDQGRWRTIQTALSPAPGNAGVFATIAAPVPVTVDTRAGYTSIGSAGKRVRFNNRLELMFIDADGTERSLGMADWSRYTAGDDGVYVKEIWPGIDLEITVMPEAVKTSFFINRPMPAYAGGQLAIRDRLKTDEGLFMNKPGKAQWHGPLEIRHVSGQTVLTIKPAVAYEKQQAANTVERLDYRMLEKDLDIMIPGTWLNRAATAYPVVIDPFFQGSSSTPIAGPGYVTNCYSMTGGCTYTALVPVPAAITITDLYFTFQFYVDPIAGNKDKGTFDLKVGSCRSPSLNGYMWACQQPTPGPCGGNVLHIFNDVKSCLPAPQCLPYDLSMDLRFLQCAIQGTQPCDPTYVWATQPLVLTVEGWTIEQKDISVSAPNATICEGDSTDLDATPNYGVPPFSYLWTPGGQTSAIINVKPVVNTTYIVQFTDSCGRTALDTVDVFVTPSDNPGFTFDPDSVCPGTPISVHALGSGPDSYYSWDAPGSRTPSPGAVKDWTAVYDTGGVYNIVMYYQSGNCKFPDTEQVVIHAEVNTEVYDTICDGENYYFNDTVYTRSGTYGRHYASVYGCDSTRILHLLVHPIPPTPLASSNAPVCDGDDLQLEAAEIRDVSYTWSGPGGFASTARDPVIHDVSPGNAGVYYVTSTRNNCISPPDSVQVVVNPLPEIAIRSDKTDICAGDSVRFETVQSPAYRYQWSPGYFMLTNDKAVAYASVLYNSYIKVRVTDTVRCVSEDSLLIYTHPCCGLYLPDAFSPNGDGKNDVFRIITDGYQKLSVFRIVNRWGETVFATADQRRGWDGTYKGKPQDAGTYHYYLKYGCSDGGLYEMKGTVTLLR